MTELKKKKKFPINTVKPQGAKSPKEKLIYEEITRKNIAILLRINLSCFYHNGKAVKKENKNIKNPLVYRPAVTRPPLQPFSDVLETVPFIPNFIKFDCKLI